MPPRLRPPPAPRIAVSLVQPARRTRRETRRREEAAAGRISILSVLTLQRPVDVLLERVEADGRIALVLGVRPVGGVVLGPRAAGELVKVPARVGLPRDGGEDAARRELALLVVAKVPLVPLRTLRLLPAKTTVTDALRVRALAAGAPPGLPGTGTPSTCRPGGC